MTDIYIKDYQLEIPTIKIAREIFGNALGLEEIKLKENNKFIAFNVGPMELYCWTPDPDQEVRYGTSNSINLYAPSEKIEKAFEYLKDGKDFRSVRLSSFGTKKQYKLLDIYTTSPISFIHASDHIRG